MKNVKYSIVIPVYNEEESVGPLNASIKKAMDPLNEPYETIFVNDGSNDATPARLKELKKADPHIRIITLDENSGQTLSLKVGFEVSTGDIVISMDGDLQNDPQDIPLLLDKMKQGYDVVCGWRRDRHDSLWKKAASKTANIIQGATFKSSLHDISCTLRAYTRDAIESLDLSWAGAHRFIPYLLISKGKKIAEVVVHHHARKFGKSKYSPTKIFKTSRDFIRLFLKIKRATK